MRLSRATLTQAGDAYDDVANYIDLELTPTAIAAAQVQREVQVRLEEARIWDDPKNCTLGWPGLNASPPLNPPRSKL